MSAPKSHGPVNELDICRCARCGTVRELTPHFDFLTLPGSAHDSELFCQSCAVAIADEREANLATKH